MADNNHNNHPRPMTGVDAEIQQLLNEINILPEAFQYIAAMWADFHLIIRSPEVEVWSKPRRILPKEGEQVYPILDFGDQLSTSRGEDLLDGNRAMGKLYNTIEKMIAILIERMYGGGDRSEEAIKSEVRVAFDGNIECKRKAFESLINLDENVVVVNFDPEQWGATHLQRVRVLANKGYGLPKRAPRFP